MNETRDVREWANKKESDVPEREKTRNFTVTLKHATYCELRDVVSPYIASQLHNGLKHHAHSRSYCVYYMIDELARRLQRENSSSNDSLLTKMKDQKQAPQGVKVLLVDPCQIEDYMTAKKRENFFSRISPKQRALYERAVAYFDNQSDELDRLFGLDGYDKPATPIDELLKTAKYWRRKGKKDPCDADIDGIELTRVTFPEIDALHEIAGCEHLNEEYDAASMFDLNDGDRERISLNIVKLNDETLKSFVGY